MIYAAHSRYLDRLSVGNREPNDVDAYTRTSGRSIRNASATVIDFSPSFCDLPGQNYLRNSDDIGSVVDTQEIPQPQFANPIDIMLPRRLLYRIINFFLAYFYPLVPLPHRPTFLNDLSNNREERPGEEEWIAMVFAIIGFTVVQAPCQKLEMSKTEARDLVQRCCASVGAFLGGEYSNEQATCTRCEFWWIHSR